MARIVGMPMAIGRAGCRARGLDLIRVLDPGLWHACGQGVGPGAWIWLGSRSRVVACLWAGCRARGLDLVRF